MYGSRLLIGDLVSIAWLLRSKSTNKIDDVEQCDEQVWTLFQLSNGLVFMLGSFFIATFSNQEKSLDFTFYNLLLGSINGYSFTQLSPCSEITHEIWQANAYASLYCARNSQKIAF